MKKLFLVLATCLLSVCVVVPIKQAKAIEMESLDKMLSGERTLAMGGIYLLRCISLYQLNAGWLNSMPDKSMKDVALKYEKSAELMLALWLQFNEIFSPGSKPNMQQFEAQTALMLKEYKDRMVKSKAFTGNAFKDEIVRSDMKTCSQFQPIVIEILRAHKKRLR